MTRNQILRPTVVTVAIVMALGLAGCGGGGGNGNVRPPPPVSPPPPTTPPSVAPPPSTPYDPAYNHLIPTGAQAAQQDGFTGKGVNVGIIDSGVDPTAPPMDGRIAWFKSYLSGGSQSPNDTSGHGTVVADILGGLAAGTLSGDDNKTFPGGVAPEANLYFEQVCGSAGATDCTLSAANYSDFVAKGVKVINAAFGAGNAQTAFTGPADPNIAKMRAIFQPAVDAGILQVWAAGSNGAAQPWNQAGLPYWIPSFQPNWLAVVGVAIDSKGQPDGLYKGTVAPSNACGIAAQWCISASAAVEFPGVAGRFSSGSASGTTASTAIVSGVAAQVLQAFPWMSAANLSATLLTTATPLDDGSHKTPNATFGWGMVNAAKAVKGPAQFAFGAFNADVPSGATSIFANDIGGTGGLTKMGAGALMLAGSDTYTGGTQVLDGALRAAHTLPGDVTVGANGTLQAVPEAAGNLSNDGVVAVRGGDTAVGGNYTQGSTGTLAVNLGSKLAVQGEATLTGGKLQVTGADTGYVAAAHTEVLTAAGGVTGTFDQLVKGPGVVFTSTTIGYDGKDVYLDTTGLNITAAAVSMGIVEPAAAAAAVRVQGGFDSLDASVSSGQRVAPEVLQGAGAIQHAATSAAARTTLQSLSGQLHAASAAMLLDTIDATGDTLSRHVQDLLDGRATPGAWYASLDWQGELARSGYAGVTSRTGGNLAGGDIALGPQAIVGYAVGASRGYGQLNASWDHSSSWANHILAYGVLSDGPWYASAQLGNGRYRTNLQRLLWLGQLAAPVASRTSGHYLTSMLETGFTRRVAGVQVSPFVDLRYQRLDLGAFTEQGGYGFGLQANRRALTRVQSGLGLRGEGRWRLANGMWMGFAGSAEWWHALSQNGDVFSASFTGFDQWLPVSGVGLSRNESVLRAGISLWPTQRFGLQLDLTREQGERVESNNAMLRGTLTF